MAASHVHADQTDASNANASGKQKKSGDRIQSCPTLFLVSYILVFFVFLS